MGLGIFFLNLSHLILKARLYYPYKISWAFFLFFNALNKFYSIWIIYFFTFCKSCLKICLGRWVFFVRKLFLL